MVAMNKQQQTPPISVYKSGDPKIIQQFSLVLGRLGPSHFGSSVNTTCILSVAICLISLQMFVNDLRHPYFVVW
jgi:hypothetical protein